MSDIEIVDDLRNVGCELLNEKNSSTCPDIWCNIGFLLYVFLWEVMLSEIVPGVRFLSLSYYSGSVMRAVDERRLVGEDMLSSGVAIGASVGVFVIFLLLSIRRLHRMDVP